MLLTSQHLFVHSPSTHYSLFSNPYVTRNCNLSLSLSIALRQHHLHTPPHFPILNLKPLRPDRFSSLRTHADPFRLGAYESETAAPKHAVGDFNFDSLLSLIELSCLLSSAIVSIGVAVNSVIAGSKKELLVGIGNRVILWGMLLMVVGVLTGAWIRRRQWGRVCRETVKGGLEVNFPERIEKLEGDLKSLATVVRASSRQLEKLGIRFRVTRKALKEPLTETAALAQKNSEAARALAVQSDILEKELGEIQQVLLAMQEQQRKQLDLILAIGKTGRLWESKGESSAEQDTLETPKSAEDEIKQEVHQI